MANSSSNYISFAAAAEASGSDKFFQDGSQRFYPHHLDRFRDCNGNLVEIGMDEGKSLGLWRQYLPNAFLHGIDIGIESEGDRFLFIAVIRVILSSCEWLLLRFRQHLPLSMTAPTFLSISG